MPEATFELISFDLCPYVQRSAITLEEKGLPYRVTYIDLADKPAWFLAISPLGKVPVLRVRDVVLFESAVINEYLDEVGGGPRLHPADPLARARDRAWIEVVSTALVDEWRLMMAPDEAEARRRSDALRERLARFEGELGDDGPLWHGEAMSLVDAAMAPLLQRAAWIQALAPGLGLLDDLPRVARWSEALLARPSLRASTVPDIEARFHAYLRGGGSPTRKAECSWLGQRAPA